jgi:hypothetical protein
MLDFVEKALHQMTFSIQPSVVSAPLPAALMRWNHRCRALSEYKVKEGLSRISSVRNDMLTRQSVQQGIGLFEVVAVSTCQAQAQGIAQAINADMDFGAEATTTTPQRLVGLSASFAFFEHLRHKDALAPLCYPATRFPCRTAERNAASSRPILLAHTIWRSVCKLRSSRRILAATSAIVRRFVLSIAPLLQSGGISALIPPLLADVSASIVGSVSIARLSVLSLS